MVASKFFVGKNVPESLKEYLGQTLSVDIKKVRHTEEDGTETKSLSVSFPEQPLKTEIEEAARKENLKVRFWHPGSRGTMDARKDRINIKLDEKGVIYDIHIG